MDRLTELIQKALEAFAVGDAMGMPTEYMNRDEIKTRFGFVDRLLDPKVSPLHPELPMAKVTDDTEQLLYLLDEYLKERKVTVEATVRALLQWFEEAEPVRHGYIGPNSRKALERLRRGDPPEITGKEGTTCGGVMRVAAAALCTPLGNWDLLIKNVHACLLPTHNTQVAIEAAMAFAFAVHSALAGRGLEGTLRRALEGATVGRRMGTKLVGASTKARVKFVLKEIKNFKDKEEVMEFLYEVVGTEMASNQVTPVVLGIVSFSWQDPWQAICMGCSIGGDTDTIAALSGLLSTLLSGSHNIPKDVVKQVMVVNNLDLAGYAFRIKEFFQNDL
ncbi:MAG: hypothetical protein DRN61_02900 [Thaumarchaeota archaeon]|nr:MAG: hypothetical protein DRN61_02900 [Nitrososphaerota archaeon]